MVDRVLAANPQQLAQYCSGKTKLAGFFTGVKLKPLPGGGEGVTARDRYRDREKRNKLFLDFLKENQEFHPEKIMEFHLRSLIKNSTV